MPKAETSAAKSANRLSDLRARREAAERDLRAAEVEEDHAERAERVQALATDPTMAGLAMNGQLAVHAQAGLYSDPALNEAAKRVAIEAPISPVVDQPNHA